MSLGFFFEPGATLGFQFIGDFGGSSGGAGVIPPFFTAGGDLGRPDPQDFGFNVLGPLADSIAERQRIERQIEELARAQAAAAAAEAARIELRTGIAGDARLGLLSEPREDTGASPFIPSLPGQQVLGFNVNEPFLRGSEEDPAGPIDPRVAFASTQTLRDLLEALGEILPDPRDPAVIKQVILYWLGEAYRRWKLARLQKLLDRAAEKFAIQRQLWLQQWILHFQSLQPWPQFFNSETLERAAALVPDIPKTLPPRPEPPVQRVAVCAWEVEEEPCLSDKQ